MWRMPSYDELDPQALDTGEIHIDGSAFVKLWRHCEASRRQVVADVHTHRKGKAHGIVATQDSAAVYRDQEIVAAITALDDASWWYERNHTATILRTCDDYIATFRTTFRHARGITFVDPHLDPRETRYRESISSMLTFISRVNPACRIEFVAQGNPAEGSGDGLVATLAEALHGLGLFVSVKLVRREFFRPFSHDRFILSNFGAFSLTNGIDVDLSARPRKMTVCLLEQKVSEELQRDITAATAVSSCQRFDLAT